MKHLVIIILVPFFLIACGQRGNHTGLATTDYSVQKTNKWSIKFSEDEQTMIEKRTHLRHELVLEKKILKTAKNQKTISINNGNTPPIMSDISSTNPKITMTDLSGHEHLLTLPIITKFNEDMDGLSFYLTKNLSPNLNQVSIDFCEMAHDQNLIAENFELKEKISFEKLEQHFYEKDGKTNINFQRNLALCQKVLKEIYTLNFKSNHPTIDQSELAQLFKEMGVELKKSDLFHLTTSSEKAVLYRYDFKPLNLSLNIDEQLHFESLPIQVDIELNHSKLPKLFPGKYQQISFLHLKPKKQIQTSMQHQVEIKKEIVYSETCMQSGERKSCEKGKLVEKDIGPNIITEEEVLTFEENEMSQEEMELWKTYFFTTENTTLSTPLQLFENTPQQNFILKRQRSIHYPYNNKPSGIIEISENEVLSSPKVRLNALQVFYRMKNVDRSYSIGR